MTVFVKAGPDANESYDRAELSAVVQVFDHAPSWKIPVDLDEADRDLKLPPHRSRLRNAKTIQLENGMKVILLPSSSFPLAITRLLVHSGRIDEPGDKAGLARLATAFLSSGGAKVRLDSASSFSFSHVGASFFTDVDMHAITASAEGQSRFVDIMIHNLEKTVRGRYSAMLLARFHETVQKELDDPDIERTWRNEVRARQAVYGADHPYARQPSITVRSLRRVDVDALSDFHKRHFRPNNSTLIITGQFDPTLVEKHVRFSFEDWKKRDKPPTSPIAPTSRKPGAVYFGLAYDKRQVQNQILAVFATPPGIDENYPVRLVATKILEFRMAAIRERLAASYGIHVSHQPSVGPGTLAIYGAVDSERKGQVLARILNELTRLAAGGDIQHEFIIARRRVARSLLVETTSTREVARQLQFLVKHDLPLDFWDRVLQRVGPAPTRRRQTPVCRRTGQRAGDHSVDGQAGRCRTSLPRRRHHRV
ncbi:MAG: insulinase family protein [Proteobacteria bacterium]|nr:insulinase family protein [Pseudomonadota bacterium]